jgi:hypothetical protein
VGGCASVDRVDDEKCDLAAGELCVVWSWPCSRGPDQRFADDWTATDLPGAEETPGMRACGAGEAPQ